MPLAAALPGVKKIALGRRISDRWGLGKAFGIKNEIAKTQGNQFFHILESILPPSRVNAVAETVAALGKGYRAIGGSAQLVTDGWAVTRPE
jgi:hypothetical protein